MLSVERFLALIPGVSNRMLMPFSYVPPIERILGLVVGISDCAVEYF